MDIDDLRNFQANMRYWRLKKDITVTRMAKLLHKQNSWINAAEAGNYVGYPKPAEMLAVAQILKKPMREMVKPLPKGTVLYISPAEQETGISNLEAIRINRGMSKSAFAFYIGVSVSQYYLNTTGSSTYSVKKWWTIAENLGVKLTTLIGRNENAIQD